MSGRANPIQMRRGTEWPPWAVGAIYHSLGKQTSLMAEVAATMPIPTSIPIRILIAVKINVKIGAGIVAVAVVATENELVRFFFIFFLSISRDHSACV